MKLKCDNCGATIESGIINCINHHYNDCAAKKEENIGIGVAVYLPPMSFTPIKELNNKKENEKL